MGASYSHLNRTASASTYCLDQARSPVTSCYLEDSTFLIISRLTYKVQPGRNALDVRCCLREDVRSSKIKKKSQSHGQSKQDRVTGDRRIVPCPRQDCVVGCTVNLGIVVFCYTAKRGSFVTRGDGK